MSERQRVLIVEDDKFWIDNCRRALKNQPVEIHDAMRAQQAIDILQRECFAAVFVDLEVPGIKENVFGGFEVLEHVRDINPYTETVVITAHEEQEVLNRVAKYEVSLCITKPVNFREIQFATELIVTAWERRLDWLFNVLETFSTCADILSDRKHNRPSFKISNEYDVQDILHVILKPFYPDIVPEEHTAKRAGSEKRIDFVVKGLETVIEVKMIRSKEHARRLADELDVDIRNYHTHPACKRLICFVYDPKRLISDPRRVEKDLSGETTQKGKTINVTIIVRPS
jgi:CheY-like chemotaxis protein